MKYYKFLSDNLSSYQNPDFYYPSPIFKNGKWIPSKWIEEKDFEKSDRSCGKGLHLMKILNPIYTQYKGNCYEAEGSNLLGEDEFKARFQKIRLIKPVSRDEIFKHYADLRNADLSNADLSYVNLRNANLSNVNLSYADLRNADLSNADLSYVNLRNANLSNVNLSYADLSNADLSNVNLSYANLSYAENINESFNLNSVYWNKFTVIDKEFKKLLNKERFLR
jgi:hypothetical protein